MKADRPYAGETTDARRARRRLQLLEAGFDLLAESGLDQMSRRRVIAAANLSDRYFSESFTSVDQFVDAVHTWQLEKLAAHFAAVSAAVQGGMRDRIRANVQAAMSFLTDDSRRTALLDAARGRDESPRNLREQLAFLVATAMASEAAKGQLSIPHGQKYLELATLLIANGGIDLVTLWVDGRLGAVTSQELEETLVNLIIDAAGIAQESSQ